MRGNDYLPVPSRSLACETKADLPNEPKLQQIFGVSIKSGKQFFSPLLRNLLILPVFYGVPGAPVNDRQSFPSNSRLLEGLYIVFGELGLQSCVNSSSLPFVY